MIFTLRTEKQFDMKLKDDPFYFLRFQEIYHNTLSVLAVVNKAFDTDESIQWKVMKNIYKTFN